VNLAAPGSHLVRNVLPELSGPELRIQEALNQRSVGALLRNVLLAPLRPSSEGLADEVLQRRRQTKALDALRSPLSRDLIARRSPNLLRVALEEREV
jgi:hypothetical protein